MISKMEVNDHLHDPATFIHKNWCTDPRVTAEVVLKRKCPVLLTRTGQAIMTAEYRL
jgi:hypothetical protein